MLDVVDALTQFESDDAICAILFTGSEKAFAAGADIKEMVELDYLAAMSKQFLGDWERIAQCRKPTIAAVAGYALGGGCEIAMMCDFILAADNAQFGQPEIKIGTMPGLGGTQRLVQAVGKSKAMEMCLTGRMMDAAEAERSGLVSRVLPLNEFLPEAKKVARSIAAQSNSAAALIKESINASQNMSLQQGIKMERRAFYSLFGTQNQQEGMRAFVEKRKPNFS
ncbi:UNVERIFIED_CONTAM: hypothetical protein GTU68_050362 [Idotea baltica]|nr:hypothetical protein [Idotea baltica]